MQPQPEQPAEEIKRLQRRIDDLTSQLAAANEALKKEVAERERAEGQPSRTIQELQAQQSMLTESEQRFRAIFDEAGTGISLVDLQHPGTPIQNNRALQTMLGAMGRT